MKTLCSFLLAVVLMYSCSVTASAEEATYNTAGDLYQAWCENLPDYICGVWSTDGGTNNLTFGIQNNASGNAGKQEMLDLVENDSTLTFVYQEYSRKDLLQMQREIDEYMKKESGLISTALDEQNNCIELGIRKERKDDAETRSMIEDITSKYGKAVSIEYTDAVYEPTVAEDNSRWSQPFLVFTMSVVAVLLVGMLVVFRKRHVPLLQTNNGETVFATTSPSTKDVVDLVRRTTYDIPSEFDQKVMAEIDKIK